MSMEILSAYLDHRCVGCDNREIQRNACNIMESSQPSVLPVGHRIQGSGLLKAAEICHRSMSTPVNLTKSLSFTISQPIPPICNASLSSSAPDFTASRLPQLIQIFIRTLNDRTISIKIDPRLTIRDLKQTIWAIERISPDHQRLVSKGREYGDNSRLSELCLAGYTMSLLIRLMGGVKVFIDVSSLDESSCHQIAVDIQQKDGLEQFLVDICHGFSISRKMLEKLGLYDEDNLFSDINSLNRLASAMKIIERCPSFKIKIQYRGNRSYLTYGSSEIVELCLGDNILIKPTLYPQLAEGTICNFTISPNLPSGLTISDDTGEMSGRPDTLSAPDNYNISCYIIDGLNEIHTLETSIGICVTKQPSDDLREQVKFGSTVYDWLSIEVYNLILSLKKEFSPQVSDEADSKVEHKGKDSKHRTVIDETQFLTDILRWRRGLDLNFHCELQKIRIILQYIFGRRDFGTTENDIFAARVQAITGIDVVEWYKNGNVLLIRLNSLTYKLHLSQQLLRPVDRPEAIRLLAQVRTCLDEVIAPTLGQFAEISMKRHLVAHVPPDFSPCNTDLLKEYLYAIYSPPEDYPLRIEHLECDSDDKCRPEFYYKCPFHMLSREARICSVFCQYQVIYEVKFWDLTALCALIANCSLFGPEIKKICDNIRKCRNWVCHINLDAKFQESFEWMEKLLKEIKCEEKLAQLEDHRTRFKAFYPAKNSIDDFDRNESRLKVLTNDQWTLVKPFIESSEPYRQLIEAPAGSGKTLMAIKMCVSKLMNDDDCQKILLLTHSASLVSKVLIPEIVIELAFHNHKNEIISEGRWGTVFVSKSSASKLYVSTIDDLIQVNIGRDCTVEEFESFISSFDSQKFDSIVVDEGHHVFSEQDDSSLEGQHRIPEELVGDVIDWMLDDSSQLIIFHDPIQTPIIPPLFPRNCERKSNVIRHMIRCTGMIRDFSMLCAKSLDYSSSAAISFSPLLDKSVKGPKVVVKQAIVPYQYEESLIEIFDELSVRYSRKIQCSEVAVLFTASFFKLLSSDFFVKDVHCEMDRLKESVKKKNYSWMKDSKLSNSIYWGRAENFCGLECAFVVIICGNFDYVDPYVYTAITRCSFQLCFIGNSVPANYYNITESTGSFAESNELGVVHASLPSEDKFIPPLLLDLANPPSSRLLQLERKIRIQYVTSDLWRKKAILSSCLCLERLELNDCFSDELDTETRHVIIDDAIAQCTDAIVCLDISCNCLRVITEGIFRKVHLVLLRLQGNQFLTVPESIGSLGQLQELYLNSNCLVELPASIGSLSLLQAIYLSSNRLEWLPDSIGNLLLLEILSADGNCLSCLPSSVSNLVNLKQVTISDNRIQYLPNLSGCTQLMALSARNNMLTEYPVCLASLHSLQLLDLDCNPFCFAL